MEEPFSIDEQIAEVKRELSFRPRVYGRWVSDGRMTQAQCEERIGRLQAALATLEGVRDEQQAKVAPGLF
jgi:hypothetical protein